VVVERFLAVAHPARKLSLWGLGLTALAVGSWWIVGLEPFSVEATVAVVVAGMAAAVAGWMTRPPTVPGQGSIRTWVVLAVGAAGWQVAAFLQTPRHDHPTLSSLANAILDTQQARATAFMLWLVAMFLLARR
jgi:hypothetical protein